jgi:guanylate kinase
LRVFYHPRRTQALSESEGSAPAQAHRVLAGIEHYRYPKPLLVIISGPSGVGKDSVVRRMRELDPTLHFVVTTTDRPPRPGEIEGIDYHFVSTARFRDMIADDELLEYALVYGQYKGVPREGVRQALASGRDVIMRLDVQGAATISKRVPQALTIFLLPPSLDVLVQRLGGRATDSPEQMAQRLQTALAELKRLEEFDYAVVNEHDALDQTVSKIMAIMAAEKCRVARREIVL